MTVTTATVDLLFERVLRECPERAHVFEYFMRWIPSTGVNRGRVLETGMAVSDDEFEKLPWGQEDSWRGAIWYSSRPDFRRHPAVWNQRGKGSHVLAGPHRVPNTVGIWITNMFMGQASHIVGLRGQLAPDRLDLPDLPETLHRHVVDTEDEVVAKAIKLIMRRDHPGFDDE